MSAIAYPRGYRPSARQLALAAVGLGLLLFIAASVLAPRVPAAPLTPEQIAPNAAPLDLGAPGAVTPAPREQLPAGGPTLPGQAADRAKGIMRTGPIPAGVNGAGSLDSGDGDVTCGKTECGP